MNFLDNYLLSLVIWLPIVGGALVLLISGSHRPGVARWSSLLVSILTFWVSLSLWTRFDRSSSDMQFVERGPWIDRFNIEYFLGVDGISVPLILLTTFLTIIVVIAGWRVIQTRVAQYFASFLVMEGLMIGVFCALDSILFYLFWEAMLIPMFLIIGVWGGPNRVYAAIKFFLYTLAGSLLMLVALLYLYNVSQGSFDVLVFQQLPLSSGVQTLIFLAFLPRLQSRCQWCPYTPGFLMRM